MRTCCRWKDILEHAEHQHAPEKYAAWLADPGCPCWIAETPGGAPVGYLVATPPDLPLPDLDPRDLEIRRIYLLYRFQGLGVGGWLMEQVLNHAAAANCRRVLLGVYSRNEGARWRSTSASASRGPVRGNSASARIITNDFILQRAP